MRSTGAPARMMRSTWRITPSTPWRAAIATRQRRRQSSQPRRHAISPHGHAIPLPPGPAADPTRAAAGPTPPAAPLAALPLAQVLRSYLITTMSSSPALLSASTGVLRRMLESSNPLVSLRNPLLRALLHETFYKQFCAGESAAQIGRKCAELRQLGYSGVILEYAREVLRDAATDEAEDVAAWRRGMLDTIAMAAEGDFCALKWSGMGAAALRRMAEEKPPSREMAEAMHAAASAAADKNISLLPSAEESWSVNGFQQWSLDMQRAYNTRGKAVVYTTYQMYLKDMPARIARHLDIAQADGFTLGAKLVRGAYLASDRRRLIHDTIQDTHHAYDAATSALLRRRYNDFLRPTTPGRATMRDAVHVVVASHNAATVEKAQALRRQQKQRGEPLAPLAFAQLQGMADEVSCRLLAAARATPHDPHAVRERVFKATTWGTMHECLNYLLRRAAENQDAAGRTRDTRNAMAAELARRLRAAFAREA